MLNVAQITSTLAKLPDQALQRYAAMHKDDPYIMALAVSESNRRKEMRGAAQAPQGGEMPKVVDQDIAAMAPQALPEDQGIGRLPAGNMNFAGGGIIAFGDGGNVERYQSAGLVQPPSMGTEYAIPGMTQPATSRFAPTGTPGEATILKAIEAAEAASRRFTGMPLSDAQKQQIRASFGEDFAQSARTMVPTPTPARAPAAALAPAAATATPPAAPPPAAPPPTTTERAPGAGAPRAAAPAAPAAPAPNLDAAQMMKDALEAAGKKANQFAPDIETLGKERVAAKEAQAAGLKAIHEKFDDIYKGRRERLDARESELGKMKDHHTGLALLQAGASMMSTPGGFGRALGKGVQVGSEQYAAGMEKLQAAKDKISDARDRLEEVEAQRGELSARELFKANNEVTDAKLGAREDLIKSNMQMYGLNREEAMKVVDAQLRANLSQYEQQQQNARSAAENATRLQAANAPSPQERIAKALGGGDLAKGLARMTEIQAGKFDPRKAYSDYLIAAQKMPGTDLMSYSQFRSQFQIPAEPSNNPAAAAPGTQLARPPGT